MDDNIAWAETHDQTMGDENPNLVTLPIQTSDGIEDTVLKMEPMDTESEQPVATGDVTATTTTTVETNGKRPPRTKRETVTCEVCNIVMHPSHYEAHMNGAKHARVVKKLANAEGATPDAAPAATNPLRAASGAKSRESVKSALAACVKPVIGLNFIKEVQDDSSPSPLYHCSMCNSVLDTSAIVLHVLGRKHCMIYMRRHYPEYSRDIAKNAPTRAEQQELLSKYATLIEEKEGRGEVGIEEDPAVIAELLRSKRGKPTATAEANPNSPGTKRSIVGNDATAQPKKGRVMQGVAAVQQPAYMEKQEAPLTLLEGMRRCIRLLDTDSICTEMESDIGTLLSNQLSVALMNYQRRISASGPGPNTQMQRLQQQPGAVALYSLASETKPSGNQGRNKRAKRRGRGAKANAQPDNRSYVDTQMYDQQPQQQGYSSFSNYDPNNSLFQ